MKHSFYRPHPRVQIDGTLTDPVTGEVYRPPAMTKQNFVQECDINNILKQFKKSGVITHIKDQAQQGRYEDLPSDLDYQESLNTVIRAEESFDSLPSKIRTRFNNDPQEFLEFLHNPLNQDEAIELGLARDTRPPPGTGSAASSVAPASSPPGASQDASSAGEGVSPPK